MPSRARGRAWIVLAATMAMVAGACTSDGGDDASPTSTSVAGGAPTEDVARYILPPGNYGGLPVTESSLDQLPLYDGLTPLRGDISDADLEEHFIPEDFTPIEPTTVEETGRDGLEIVYDAFGVPHITGETREDVAFGAGWVTARDRDLLIGLARGPARAAALDVPGLDAFGLVTSGQSFVPSAAAEDQLEQQWDLIVETYGEEGEEMRADADAGAAGANAFYEARGEPIDPPITANDILAVTAFIGSIFGSGGGGEAEMATFLAELQTALGEERGQEAWEDAMLSLDPEAPTTIDDEFDYGPLTGGDAITGSVVLDAGSVESFEPVPGGAEEEAGADEPEAVPASATVGPLAPAPAPDGQVPGLVDAAAHPRDRKASNFLVADPTRSATGSTQAVMGPQLGYYYPEIVQQVHLKGPGFEAQGAAVPGLTMYLLLGRTRDYAWSLTSAGHDVRDTFVEELCEPEGAPPTRATQSYRFDGECVPMETFDAGLLNGSPVTYPVTEHGPVVGTATVDGVPVALSRQRSTFGRDGLNLMALKNMTEGEAETPEDFFDIADQFEFTFNWAYASRTDTAYFSSGRMPVRAAGLDRRLPTLGTGEYEWEGFLERDEHPHSVSGPGGLLLNWNNQSAPGFLHGDSNGYGSVHNVELFSGLPEATELTDVVGTMNRAATEDVRAPAWPVVSEVLAGGDAPDELSAEVVDLLDAWVADDAPRLDADDDGDYDSPGPAIIDALWEPLVRAAMAPVYGDQLDALAEVRDLAGNDGSSYLDKDLRTLLGEEVDGPFALSYCGGGDLAACQESLWAVVAETAAVLAAALGDDPAEWLTEALRTTFIPGLIDDSMRATNRPTFQQVLQLAPEQ